MKLQRDPAGFNWHIIDDAGVIVGYASYKRGGRFWHVVVRGEIPDRRICLDTFPQVQRYVERLA